MRRSRRQTSGRGLIVVASTAKASTGTSAPAAGAALPSPEVKIDNVTDPVATILSVRFGNILGELLDTTQALRNLGLSITRAEITEGDDRNRFYVTDAKTGAKVTDPIRIDEIRETIIRNMLEYHPESAQAGLSAFLGAKKPSDKAEAPLGVSARAVQTRIYVKALAAGTRSELFIVTRDRPGLLVDICRVLADCSLNVLSASIETEGAAANDTFYVTYRGKALEGPMIELVTNALTYYLTLADIESTESY